MNAPPSKSEVMPIDDLVALLASMPSDPLIQAAHEITTLQKEVESLRAHLADPSAYDRQRSALKKAKFAIAYAHEYVPVTKCLDAALDAIKECGL